MDSRMYRHLLVIGALAVVLLVLTQGWARQNSGFEQLDVLIDIQNELQQHYVDELDTDALTRAAIRGMLEALDDPHTSYLDLQDMAEFGEQMRGTFSGIGAEVDMHEGRPRIITPLEDSPAWQAGVRPGDVILEVDGESTAGMSLNEAVNRLRGQTGTEVTIRVRRTDGERERITITRDQIRVQSVRGFRRDGENRSQYMLDEQNGIAYLRLTQFNERTVGELSRVLEQLESEDMRGLVLDVRFNPGGLLDASIEIADMFLERGQTITKVQGRGFGERTFEARQRPLVNPEIPMVVLANETSASASEIVAGALKDNNRAMVIGTRTFGKGSVQSIHELASGGGALRLTTAYYLSPSERKIQRTDDSDVWGVDPSEGGHVPMSMEQMTRMQQRRVESDLLRDEREDDPTITPELIEDELADPQLAAALRAVLGRLETGAWPSVGEDAQVVDALADRRRSLESEYEQALERLGELERELGELGGEVEEPEEVGVE